jgi:hypothetical protein
MIIDKQTYSTSALFKCITIANKNLKTPILPHNRKVITQYVINIIEKIERKQAHPKTVFDLFKRYCEHR